MNRIRNEPLIRFHASRDNGLWNDLHKLFGAIVGDDLIADDSTFLRGDFLLAGFVLRVPRKCQSDFVGWVRFCRVNNCLKWATPDGETGIFSLYEQKAFRPTLDTIRVQPQ